MKGSALYMGVDIGTSVSKGTVIDSSGAVVAQSAVYRPRLLPLEGGYEHDAEVVWWRDFLTIVRSMISQLGLRRDDIERLAITAMVVNGCPLDVNGIPLRSAVLFYDPRAQEIEKRLDVETCAERWQNKYLAMLLWLRDNMQSSWSSVRRIATTHSYLVQRLTGEFCVDSVTALECGAVFDPLRTDWRGDVLGSHGIDAAILPRIVAPATVVGEVTRPASEASGLKVGLPVIAGTSDTVSSLLGCGLREPNDILLYYGTYHCAPLLLEPMRRILSDTTTPYPIKWTVSIPRAGQQLSSLSRLLCPANSMQESLEKMSELAAKSNPGANGATFVQTAQLPDASECVEPSGFMSFGLANTTEDLCRAALEAFGYGARYCLEGTSMSVDGLKWYAGGGGACSSLWRQIMSDILNVEQWYSPCSQSAYGAAVLAAASCDLELTHVVGEGQSMTALRAQANPEFHDPYQRGYERYKGFLKAFKHRVVA